MTSIRTLLHVVCVLVVLSLSKLAIAQPAQGAALPYTPVVTPNGSTLPFTMKNGVKEFRLTAEPVKREFAKGMVVNAWGYNGSTPGPTIEAVEGDRVRFYVTNKLPERTSVHWHGILLPNGMDGVAVPGSTNHSCSITTKCRSTLGTSGTFG